MILWYPGALICSMYWTELIIMSCRLYSFFFLELIEFLHGVSKERTSLDRRSTIEQEGPESWYIQRPRPDIYSDHALVLISISCLTLVNLKFQHAPVFFIMDLLLFFFIFDVSYFFWSCNLIYFGSSFFSAIHTKIWQMFIIFHILSQTNKISFTLDKCLLLMRFRLTFLIYVQYCKACFYIKFKLYLKEINRQWQ